MPKGVPKAGCMECVRSPSVPMADGHSSQQDTDMEKAYVGVLSLSDEGEDVSAGTGAF